ncbi:S8 family serine peptidase [Psittacicella gerlachiana]|nr:S8 family serine peptidase [Psittacicella gerlachiana]
MNKNFLKLNRICTSLASVFMASLLVACGGGSSSSNNSYSNANSNSASTQISTSTSNQASTSNSATSTQDSTSSNNTTPANPVEADGAAVVFQPYIVAGDSSLNSSSSITLTDPPSLEHKNTFNLNSLTNNHSQAPKEALAPFNALGLANVDKDQVLVSQFVQDAQVPVAANTTTSDTLKLNLTRGEGTNVLIYDSYFFEKDVNINQTQVTLYDFDYNTTTSKVEFTPNTTSTETSNATSGHGSFILSILAGKRDTNSFGIAPNAMYTLVDLSQAYTKMLKLDEDNPNLTYDHPLVEAVKYFEPRIVNLSSMPSLPDWATALMNRGFEMDFQLSSEDDETSKLLGSISGATDASKLLNLDQFYALCAVLAGQSTVLKSGLSLYIDGWYPTLGQDKSPLLVNSIGNIYYSDFLKLYNGLTEVNNSDTNPQGTFKTWSDTNPYQAVFKINKEHQVAQTVIDHEGAQNTYLTVAGVITDTKGQAKAFIKEQLDKVASGEFTGLKDNPETDPSLFDFNDDVLNKKEVYISPNSYACGAAANYCVVAPFYSYGFFNNNLTSTTYDKSYVAAGTSFSAPYVTGVATLVASQFPWMTASQLKTTLMTTAYDLGTAGVDEYFGWGLVNAQMALQGPAYFAANTTFAVDMNRDASPLTHFYFSNNISGMGSLSVSGPNNRFLNLVGNQSFTGTVTVNSGNLVLARDSSIATPAILPTDYTKGEHNTSYTLTGAQAKLWLYGYKVTSITATTGNVYSHAGEASTLTLSGNAQLNVGLQAQKQADGSVALTSGLTLGQANLNDNVTLAVTMGTSYVPTQTEAKEVYAIEWSGHSGTFAGGVAVAGNSFVTLNKVSDAYDTKGYKVSYQTQTANSVANSLSLTSIDQSLAVQGAQAVDDLFARADAISAQTSVTVTNTTSTSSSSPLTDITKTTGYAQAQFELQALNTNGVSVTSTTSTSSAEASQVTLTADQTSDTTTSSETSVSSESADTATLTAASQVQNLNSTELAELFISASGVQYANLQKVANQNARLAHFKFAQTSLSRYRTDDQKVYAYLDFTAGNQLWQTNGSSLKGSAQENSFTVGAYAQKNNFNWGVAAYHANIDYKEYFRSYNQRANKANLKNNGVFFSLGYALPKAWFGASLGFVDHYAEVTRSTLSANDQSAIFKAQAYSLGFHAGYLVLGNAQAGVELNAGLTTQYHMQKAFSETATSSEASVFSLYAEKKNSFQAYANLGAKVFYNFKLFGYNAGVDAQLTFSQALQDDKFNLRLNNNRQTATGFASKFLTSVNTGFNVYLTPKVNLGINAQAQKAKDYRNFNGNVNLKLAF